MLSIKKNNLSFQELKTFLSLTSGYFIPNLYERVNIEIYAKKLYENALIIEVRDEKKIVGLLACYANDIITKRAFITSICVLKEYQRKGVAKKMFEELYAELIEKQFESIALEVSKKALPAIDLYRKEGFEILEDNIDSFVLFKKME